jgi:hypothetical protein
MPAGFAVTPFFAVAEFLLDPADRFFPAGAVFFAGLRTADFFAALGAFFLWDLAIKMIRAALSGGKRRLN